MNQYFAVYEWLDGHNSCYIKRTNLDSVLTINESLALKVLLASCLLLRWLVEQTLRQVGYFMCKKEICSFH